MRRLTSTILSLICPMLMMAQGWPAQHQGVMLQGFYWDSFSDTQWTNLEAQADELGEFFNLVWIPQSGNCGDYNSMGYNDLYWFSNYNSTFGNEQQLRSMIKTFKSKGIGTIADVVINHRSSMVGTWMSFPQETYNGKTWTMGAADICANDDGGQTALKAEVKPTGANDSGDDFGGARDIDHSSANVQAMVKAYLDFLLNDLGYTGFRYDMVKGYAASYTGMYNAAANPTYSVGEYWDGNAMALMNWVNGTKQNNTVQSAAFDFALKYNLRDCCNAGTNWGTKLSGNYLAAYPGMRRYAVTFVDNHDTYGRGNDSETKKNIVAANAFILAAPGTPCLFLPHWKSYKQNLKQMIYARNLAGINNQSNIMELSNSSSQYAMRTDGDDGKSVIILMGSQAFPSTATAADYQLIDKGANYAYYLSKNTNTAWASQPSGSYDAAINVELTAISSSAQTVVYTTDGSAPSATNGKQVGSGTSISIASSCTLRAALLNGSGTMGEITRHYTITNFEPYQITVHVKSPWASTNFYTWDSDGAADTWPGTKITNTKTIDGIEWVYNTYTVKSSSYSINFVFSTGTGSPQTVDVNNVKTDKFFEISSNMSGTKYLVDDVTSQHSTAIEGVTDNDKDIDANMPVRVYTTDGRLVRQLAPATEVREALGGLSRGLYIINNTKYAVK